jgi:outer membrane receptor protein involved in Fe transport
VGEVTNIISSYINLDPRSVEGWDAMVQYFTPEFGIGQFVFRGDMTKITKFEQQGLASDDLLRRNGNPELRYTLAVDWQLGGWDANITMRYIDDVYDTSLFGSLSSGISGTPDEDLNRIYWDVDSWTTYNLSLGYDFSVLGNSLEGLRLTGGVRNLFDEDPPFADESFGFLTSLHNSFGRILWLKADYAF